MTAGKKEGWLLRLARRAGLEPVSEEVAARLAELQTTVEALGKTAARSGKEQFRANALAEALQQSVKAALEQLREAEVVRQREVAQLRQELQQAREGARLALVESLLPGLDGLDETLAAGERLHQRLEKKPVRRPGLFPRLKAAVRALFSSPAPAGTVDPAMAAWLEGLRLVQERFLEVLAAEGVHPIETTGASFDPHWHMAVETIVAGGEVAPESIARETRRGYAAEDRVLRYAEVVVARRSAAERE